jgi:uncharacterized protein YlaN (UPF0358 family)
MNTEDVVLSECKLVMVCDGSDLYFEFHGTQREIAFALALAMIRDENSGDVIARTFKIAVEAYEEFKEERS